MKIFITGAGGYVGSRLVKSLMNHHELVCCDVVPCPEGLDQSLEWLQFDETPRTKALVDMMQGCEAVVHLAQSPYYREFPEKAEEVFDTNVAFCLRLLEAARQSQVRSFTLFSSGGVYGTGSNKEFHELDRLNPLDFYLSTKATSELLARKYRQFINVHIVRPFFIYGPDQEGKLISILADRIRSGQAVFINGDGEGGRMNPIHVDDVVKLTGRLLEIRGNCTLNFAGPDTVSIRDIIEIIGEYVGVKPIIGRKLDGEPMEMIADTSRIKECFSDFELTPFREGLLFLKEQ